MRRITKKVVADILSSYYEKINNQKTTIKPLEIKYTVTEELGETVINISVKEELTKHFSKLQKGYRVEKMTYHYMVEKKELLDDWYEVIYKF